ncbi:MAG: peptide deformylase [bacterium]
MATREILVMGDTRLREKSKPIDVEEIKTKEMQDLIRNLRDTAKLNPEGEGFVTVGLSAPQMNHPVRIFVIVKDADDRRSPKFEVFINPELDIEKTHMISGNESCLSTPGICGLVSRYDNVKVTFYDENSKKHKEKLSGERSVFVQHEVDHLDGILWIDRVSDTKTLSYC